MKKFLASIVFICIHLFSSEIVNHVNVMTGKLQLGFEDNVINAAVPLAVSRTYNSSHHTEPSHAKWNFTEGWSFFSHAQLYLDDEFDRAYIIESNGSLMKFEAKNTKDSIIKMYPETQINARSQAMNYRQNPLNNRLRFNIKTGSARLKLADGSFRFYQRSKKIKGTLSALLGLYKNVGSEYLLIKEIFPSGQRVNYSYSDDLKKVTISNQFSEITLNQIRDYPDFKILASCSDGKKINYFGRALNKRCHLVSMEKEGDARTCFSYIEDTSTKKFWVKDITVSDKEVLNITYCFPEVKKSGNFFSNSTFVRHNVYGSYKVLSISKNGEKLSDFYYTKNLTIVTDAMGFETKYHYKDGGFDKIEYPDGSLEEFFWEDGNLVKKTYSDKEKNLLFSKTFLYDKFKNVIKETITGDESYSKWYSYDKNHLCIEEKEESGLTFQYKYLSDTELVTCKKTLKENTLLLQEDTLYDKRFLVYEKRSTDGFLETKISYKRDFKTGLVTQIDNGLHSVFYEYDSAGQLVKERTAFGETTNEYDGLGRIISKTHPLGGKEEYIYDDRSNPTEIKLTCSLKKTINYDLHNRPISCEMDGRISTNHYDLKSNLIEEIDYKGAKTFYEYDCFGRCIKKRLPLEIEISYEYDIFGNVVKEISPNGNITKTCYNIFNKPTHIVFADNSEIFHRYSGNGNLLETTLQDGSNIVYEYDLLNRVISKEQGSCKEYFEYEGAILKKIKDARGLVTIYEYDEFGKKISEDREGRKVEFFYDDMNLIYKTVCEDREAFELHDIEGRVISTHTNGKGVINYKYDKGGRKSKAIKTTSCGKAIDKFCYDLHGRLICHTDPLEQKTLHLYEDYRRTEIDPLGNQTVEYFDPLSRVIQKDKMDPSGNVLFSEIFTYDKEGNVVKRFIPEYNIDVTYCYNCMNYLMQEVEAGKKVTSYKYDIKGRLIEKTLPDGVDIYTKYNEFDQIIEVKSSDGSIFYQYFYSGMDLVKVTDCILSASLKRSYTKYGEISHETNFLGFKSFWAYDNLGRVKEFILSDNSKIKYLYQGNHMEKVSYFSSEGSLLLEHNYIKFDENSHVEEEALAFNLGTIKSCRDLLERPYKMSSPFHNIELTFGSTGLVTHQVDSLREDKHFSYDHLSQLVKEGENTYSFDSLGNPTEYEINDLNQILSTPKEIFSYDANGCLIKRNDTAYSFDAFGRLRKIITADKTVTYTYDPFSRLFSKQTNDSGELITLYDKEFEIGRMDSDGKILQLKVLGLGIKADIGACIGLYLNEKWYIPLHDLQGNIIAITNDCGKVEEIYPSNAFGEEKAWGFINPWRFSSKRMDEGLLIFRYRFYDPCLKRWVTPDPGGFVDGRNLYRYVLNSPLNRLDQFGLEADWIFSTSYNGMRYNNFSSDDTYFSSYGNYPTDVQNYTSPLVFAGAVTFGGISTEAILICCRENYIQLTPNEIKNGEFNLFPKISDIMNGIEDGIGLTVFINGINTSKEQFFATALSLATNAPKGCAILGIYSPSAGILNDVIRVNKERRNQKTDNVLLLTNFFQEIFHIMEKGDVKSKVLTFPYSGSGATLVSAYNNMCQDDQKKMQHYLIVKGIATAIVIPQELGPETQTIYSYKDYITGWFANESNGEGVKMVDPHTKQNELSLILKEHNIKGPTYRGQIEEIFKNFDKEGRLHVGKNR